MSLTVSDCKSAYGTDSGGKLIFSSIDSNKASSTSRKHVQCEESAASSKRNLDLRATIMERQQEFRDFKVDLSLEGDIRVVLYDQHKVTHRNELMCFLWFHTGFITEERTVFDKCDVDIAWSDSKCKVFDPQFRLEFIFTEVPAERFTFHRTSMDFSRAMSVMKRSSSMVIRHKAMLGAWQSIPAPNARTLERSAKYRGGRGSTTTYGEIFSIHIDADDEDGDGLLYNLEPVADNFCPVRGPPVLHHHVHLVSVSANVLMEQPVNAAANAMEKKLIRFYQQDDNARKRHSSLLTDKIRRLVSLNKKRFQEDGYDLDLTYVTPRIIAMGYPAAKGLEGKYRNAADEVYRFFQERHSAHFRIFNLVAERGYDLDMYHGQVARYPFFDHNAPAFELLLPCCAHIHRFLQADTDNIVAVHCKAGKGRTGLVIVCYLMYGGLHVKARAARKFYDTQRCHDAKGLTIISQIRYAHYFEEYLRRLKRGFDCPIREKESPAIQLLSVSMHGCPTTSGGGCEPSLVVSVRSQDDNDESVLFSSRDHAPTERLKGRQLADRSWSLQLHKYVDGGLRCAGDIKLRIDDTVPGLTGAKAKPICWVWVHSQFMQQPPDSMAGRARALSSDECVAAGLPLGTFSLLFSKPEIDGAAKDIKNTHFPGKFALEIFWKFLEGEVGTGPALETAVNDCRGQDPDAYDKKLESMMLEEKIAYQKHCRDAQREGTKALSWSEYVLSVEQDNSVTVGSGGKPSGPDGSPPGAIGKAPRQPAAIIVQHHATHLGMSTSSSLPIPTEAERGQESESEGNPEALVRQAQGPKGQHSDTGWQLLRASMRRVSPSSLLQHTNLELASFRSSFRGFVKDIVHPALTSDVVADAAPSSPAKDVSGTMNPPREGISAVSTLSHQDPLALLGDLSEWACPLNAKNCCESRAEILLASLRVTNEDAR